MTKRPATNRVFLREFFRQFHTTGSIVPSSRSLSRSLAKYVINRDEDRPLRILEVGPGTGPVTRQIAEAMRSDDILDLVEINPEFVRVLNERLSSESVFQQIADRTRVLCQPIEDIADSEPYDVIVSGLPFNNFEPGVVESILDRFGHLARPMGRLSFFEYAGIRKLKATVIPGRKTRERMRGVTAVLEKFLTAETSRDTILRNVPPAWVHHVQFPEVAHTESTAENGQPMDSTSTSQ
ncbi:class I SAM-dependent methyltransferase [Thalassoroseus pseudoceratinae]|uniref:class I SAM-dependent methyltransferase n=1 Tax=Thalassoroseus pseudoceratinae TaxID=2713176 RepID=UPI00141DAE77|nr:methyltransferase domain-containing protein [Thalassoroseus pseudoceratinae]